MKRLSLRILAVALVLTFAQAQDKPKEPNYPAQPESARQEGVPQGTVTKSTLKSEVFPNTLREYYV